MMLFLLVAVIQRHAEQEEMPHLPIKISNLKSPTLNLNLFLYIDFFCLILHRFFKSEKELQPIIR